MATLSAREIEMDWFRRNNFRAGWWQDERCPGQTAIAEFRVSRR